MTWRGGGRALSLAAVLIGAALGAACRGGDHHEPRGDAASSASPAAGTPAGGCPLAPEACAFAAQLSTWLGRGDIARVMRQHVTADVECKGRDTPSYVTICRDTPVGERRQGYAVLQGDIPGIVTAEQYESGLRDVLEHIDPTVADGVGPGALRLAGFKIGQVGGKPCGADAATAACYVIVFTGIGRKQGTDTTTRVLLDFYVGRPPSDSVQAIDATWFIVSIPEPSWIKSYLDSVLPWSP